MLDFRVAAVRGGGQDSMAVPYFLVVVDGRPRGQSPLTIRLTPGKHVVSLRGSSTFSPSSTTITVVAGDTTRATFDVKR